MSRFPVSAAISRLAFEHLVLVEPQHGSFVSRISVREVRERLFIRRALEGEIAAEAARRFDDAARAALATTSTRLPPRRKRAIAAASIALDLEFHAILTSRLGLVRSAELLDAQRVHLERVRRLLLTPPGRMDATLAEHRGVVDGIRTGDPEIARRAMAHHMNEFGAIVENFSRTRPDLFSA